MIKLSGDTKRILAHAREELSIFANSRLETKESVKVTISVIVYNEDIEIDKFNAHIEKLKERKVIPNELLIPRWIDNILTDLYCNHYIDDNTVLELPNSWVQEYNEVLDVNPDTIEGMVTLLKNINLKLVANGDNAYLDFDVFLLGDPKDAENCPGFQFIVTENNIEPPILINDNGYAEGRNIVQSTGKRKVAFINYLKK